MAKLNLTQAANAVGIARGTLYNHIKKGKVSYELTLKGQKVIDTAELIRVYGELKNDEIPIERSRESSIEQNETPQTPEIIQTLRQRTQDLEQQIEELRKDKEASRKREEELLSIIKQQQTLLLPPTTKKTGFFSRLFGRK